MAELVGKKVRKDFGAHGIYDGVVVDFHVQTGFRVRYTDGDVEDLTPDALRKLIDKSQKLMSAAEKRENAEAEKRRLAAKAALRRNWNAPSVTLEQYVRAARNAARRKRKHTELKRAGLLAPEPAPLPELVIEEEVAQKPLVKPPSWAAGLDREPRVVKCDRSLSTEVPTTANAILRSLDLSLFQLHLSQCHPTSVTLAWVFPPANPGMTNAWIGLFKADAVQWHDRFGEVSGNGMRILWKCITRDAPCGKMTFAKLPADVADGEYVFTLQRDYGVQCAAVSERILVRGGQIVGYREDTALVTDDEKIQRKDRQLAASLGLTVKRERDTSADAGEIEDDGRFCFPVTSIEVTLGDYMDSIALLKTVYRVVDRESYLDWGLSSDYDSARDAQECGAHRLRKREADDQASKTAVHASLTAKQPFLQPLSSSEENNMLPPMLSGAARPKMGGKYGLGGGTAGSEGYGEATMGSVQKLCTILQNLRELVLTSLRPIGWGILWDLGPWSSLLDIGSGYGKVVFHLRLSARIRRAVGYECVLSRHQIGQKAGQLLGMEAEAFEATNREAAGERQASLSKSPSKRNGHRPTASGDDVVIGVPKIPVKHFDGVELRHCDATKEDRLIYTHIYIFDWVFSKTTLAEVAKVLQASPFYVLLSFRKPAEWWSYGLTKVQPVARMGGFKTTGAESMTCYIYVNMEKVPADI